MPVLRVVLIIVLSMLGGALTVKADLTGSSTITLLAEPIPCTLVNEIKLDTPCEKTLLKFDIEALIKFSLAISGVVFSMDSAVGIPGLEHLILTTNATFGMVNLTSEFWFATPYESVVDVNNLPNMVVIPPGEFLFVKKRLTVDIILGGVLLKNLAILEDVTFPNPGADYGETDCDGDGSSEGTCIGGVETNPATHYQTQSFGFGDIITLQGQTPSGITILSQTGICATNAGNAVKKFAAAGSVNPHCVAGILNRIPKSPLLFDFETVSISGIQLAPGLTSSTVLSCITDQGCGLTNTFGFLGGPIPFSTSLSLKDLFNLSFGGVNVVFNAGPTTINVSIDDQLAIQAATIHFATEVAAGNLTARLTSVASFQKGIGLSGVSIGLAVTSGTFNANHTLQLVGNSVTHAVEFGSLSISMGINIAPFRTAMQVAFGRAGLARAGMSVGLVF